MKLVLILVLLLQAPGEPAQTARVVYTNQFDTYAACHLSGEVELSRGRVDLPAGVEIVHADILCEELDVPM